MAEKYKDYFIKYNCTFSTPDPAPAPPGELSTSRGVDTLNYNFRSGASNPSNPVNVKGSMFFGVRLQDTLYIDETFRRFCGFFTRAELTADYKGVTCKMIRNYNDAARITLVKSYYMELIANTPGTNYPAYGDVHRTYVVVDNGVLEEDLVNRLYSADVLVGPSAIPYTVTAGSIEVRSSRRTKKQF